MALDDIIDLTITAQTVTPSRAGFGTPLLMAVHSVTPNRMDIYKTVKEMTDAGFAATHPAVAMATKAFSQNPKPKQVVVGKRLLNYTQTIDLYPINTTQGFHYKFTIVDPAGVSTNIDYAVPGAATVASIITALLALMGGITNVTVTNVGPGTNLHMVCTAGKLFNLKGLPLRADLKVVDTTADPGIATDLSAVEAVDSASWYAVTLDSNSKAEIVAAAAWVEARKKILLYNNSDFDCANNAVQTDVFGALKTLAYTRSGGLYSESEILSYMAVALAGKMLPQDPGSATYAFKTLAGVGADPITGGDLAAVTGKNGSVYSAVAGINITQYGKVASGDFIDNTVFLDWLYARIQERIMALLANNAKIGYTDAGAQTIRAAIEAVLKAGITAGGLAANPAPSVTVPPVADQDPLDRAARYMPGITFSANLAGAIHKVKIAGTLSV